MTSAAQITAFESVVIFFSICIAGALIVVVISSPSAPKSLHQEVLELRRQKEYEELKKEKQQLIEYLEKNK